MRLFLRPTKKDDKDKKENAIKKLLKLLIIND